jgi:hypothetical protein
MRWGRKTTGLLSANIGGSLDANKVHLRCSRQVQVVGYLEFFTTIINVSIPPVLCGKVSGFSETERVTKAQALGAVTYVKKPYVSGSLG